MKRSSSSVFVALFSALLVVFAYATTSTAPAPKPAGKGYDCEAAKKSLKPCMEYLTGGIVAVPPKECCAGVEKVKSSASTKNERHAACKCLKEAVNHIPNFNETRATSLPTLCHLRIGFNISKTVDCSK
ncbi:hypothetical protein Fmac_030727 [Flemingia macrophylla]|uniref:Non-specific lipid-transfer protein n=1 Tax=Flemingia macrophylla TaxID=520843 RepID=A0ABD1L010_9FABA